MRKLDKFSPKRRYSYKISRDDLKLGSYHLAEATDLGAVEIDNPDIFYQPAIELFVRIYNDVKEASL